MIVSSLVIIATMFVKCYNTLCENRKVMNQIELIVSEWRKKWQ